MDSAASVAEKLKALRGSLVIPIYRKTGSRLLGEDAFTRDRDTETVMDVLPYIAEVIAEVEGSKTSSPALDLLRSMLSPERR